MEQKKRKSKSFSFRIDEECLEILREEAKKKRISVNALANNIFHDYRRHGRWAKRLQGVSITRQTFSKIIDCCPEEKIKEIAQNAGDIRTKDTLLTIGSAPTYDNLKRFIKNNLGYFGNWFDYTEHTKGRKEIIHLRHGLGKKWSIFIANQMATMFKSILGITAKIEISDDFATIEIDH
jgi:hypothetical protein